MNSLITNRYLSLAGLFSAWGYVFFSIVPRAVAGKYICSGIMLIVFAVLLIRKQIHQPSFDWLNISLFVVLGLALISTVFSPYSLDSLNQIRKEAVPFMLAFILITMGNFSDKRKLMTHTMLSLILGYSVKEFLAIYAGIENGFKFSIYETPDLQLPKYLDFFSADTPYYLPFLLGTLLYWPMKLWQKLTLLTLSLCAIYIVVLSGVRAAFVFVVVSSFAIVLYRFIAYKKLIVFGMLGIMSFGYLFKDNISNPSVLRYVSIVTPQTYQYGNDNSISERYAITKGVWDIAKERLYIGYGPGWKKLPIVAKENGHIERWSLLLDPVDNKRLEYFSLGEGRVNPHNLYMRLLFEVGLLGMLAYLSLMLATAFGALKMLKDQSDPFQVGVAVSSLGYLIVYFGSSLAGGDWLSSSMLVVAVCVALSGRNKILPHELSSNA